MHFQENQFRFLAMSSESLLSNDYTGILHLYFIKIPVLVTVISIV